MTTTTLPVMEQSTPVVEPTVVHGQRESKLRANVLAALGRPARLFRVRVAPLWGDHFRVNVMTGDDPTDVRIPHSYFVASDGCGNIITSSPRIRKEY